MKMALGALGIVVLVVAIYVFGMSQGWYGEHWGPGEATEIAVPADVIQARTRTQRRAATSLTQAPTKEILFGDLHVHTTFSTDAFARALPLLGGDGAHPVGDACDYARFCSAVDFWSINDHAEATTPRKWQETKDAIRTCNAISGDPESPDVSAFLGWEWSQVGMLPEEHYGHKNVIFPGLGDDEVPARAIGAGGLATLALRGEASAVPWVVALADFPNRQIYYDFGEFMQEIREVPACPEGVSSPDLPPDCYESAATPAELFEKLDQWGFDTMVIPHGNTWGFYSPPGISLDKQLTSAQNDPSKQFLFEIMSGHGNSEEYRPWRAGVPDADGNPICPEPSPGYLPSCWRAGEIIRERCLAAGESEAECETRAVEARKNAIWVGQAGHNTVPGSTVEDWLDSGQCNDCFLPSFNYRPAGSAQYAMAISNFDEPGEPRRFEFGFVAASDNHSARPGTGYKEFGRRDNTEASGSPDATWAARVRGGEDLEPEPRSVRLEREDMLQYGLRALEAERQASFFMTGGLTAVHADSRSRGSVWDAMKRKEVYGTSGDRILLWFHLLNAERVDGSFGAIPMGGSTAMAASPRFEVRAVGAFKQKPGCPDYSVRALTPDRLQKLCQGQCFNPSDERKLITRIEVVRVRPQASPGESVSRLVEDPWKVIPCEPSPSGCVVQFEDPEFAEGGRDAAYYVRAIEEPSLSVNAGHLRCERDAEGNCVEARPCYGDYRTPREDDCLETIEERAWSSPIYVDFAGPAAPGAQASAGGLR